MSDHENSEDLSDTSNQTGKEDQYEDHDEPENLLNMEEDKAAAQIIKGFERSHNQVKPHIEQWKVNVARSKGFTGVQLLKVQDESTAFIPLQSSPDSNALNKAVRLRRRLRSTIMADPPRADAMPAGDQDEDKDAAEFSTRVLNDITGESNLGIPVLVGDAFDLGSDYGSGFIRFWVNEQGGGWKPMSIMAYPSAPDQETNDRMLEADLRDEDPIPRYVLEDGGLTDDPSEEGVLKTWFPSIEKELLTGKHVRFIPANARDMWDADGCRVGVMVPMSVLEEDFPDIKKWDDDKKARLRGEAAGGPHNLWAREVRDAPENDKPVFVVTEYRKQNPLYPKAFIGIAGGSGVMLYRGPMYDEDNQAPMDIPVVQFKQHHEEGNSYGAGEMQYTGPGNEIRAHLMGAMLQHLDTFLNRKRYVPLHSNLTPEQLQMETGTYLPVVPGGTPSVEEVPDFPRAVETLFASVTRELDDESGLQETAQGLAPSSVKSGVLAERIIEQVNIGLSGLIQNTSRGIIQSYRVILQLVKAYYRTPQRIQWTGEDGGYKEQSWTGVDLGSTRDVQLAKGSFTQLSKSAKAELARSMFDIGQLSPQEFEAITHSNLGGTLGLQDNPHRQRIRRQIDRWQDGPPEGWQPVPPPDPNQVDPQTGQPLPAQPDPIGSTMFNALPVDDGPEAAPIREYELGRVMARSRFTKHPQPWRDLFIAEYERARAAAGIQTAEEQAAAVEAAKKEGAEGQKLQLEGAKNQADAQLGQSKIQAGQETDQLKAQTELTKARMTLER